MRPLKEIFADALDLPAAERAAFLERECAADPERRGEVERLLRAHAEGERFLAQPDAAPLHEVPGTRIGPYRLLEKLGEGGFGVVFLAEQTEPLVRRVALKVIKLGMDTRQVIARFEAERQALAMMDHPNIARVLDAGATEAGRPYFVMEIVRGRPITSFCDENHLDTNARLELFQQVCHAVQHAHQKGIIHRDLKPGNVLVAMQDGKPVPKVIDFGIAKATSARLTAKTVFTQQRAWIGTPEYMSPEQSGLGGSDVDTRSDVYSLGVLLYELLTGTTPFSARELREGAFEEVQRMIREVEPPRPSTRISTMSDGIASVAACRRTEPAQLAKLVRGDLDWIVMKCIEKDRARRYETANGLAQDVLRHLRGEAVLAAPPSAAYRVRKFVRLHRVGVAAGGAVAAALVLGLAGTSTGLAWALREEERAGEKAKEAKDAASRAERSADEARAVTDFLTGILGLANADVSQRPDLTVGEVLDLAASQVGDALRDQPEAEANARTVIGKAYDTQGEPTLAVLQLRRALEIRDGPTGGTPEQLYDILYTYMFAVLDATQENEFIPRGGIYRVALTCQRVIAERHPELGETCSSILRTIQRRPFDASRIRSSLDELKALALAHVPPDDSTWILVGDYFLGCADTLSRLVRDEPGLAIPPAQEGIAIYRRVLPETNTRIARSMDFLVGYLEAADRHAEAEEVARRALDLASQRLPEDHWYVAWCKERVGAGLLRQGRLAEAETLLDAAFQPLDAAHPTSPRTLRTLLALLELHERAGRKEQAEVVRGKLVDRVARCASLDEAVTADALLGPELAGLAESVRAATDALGRQSTDAGELYAALVALRRKRFQDDDPRAVCLANLVNPPAEAFAIRANRPEEPLRVFVDLVEIGRASSILSADRRALNLWWCSRLCWKLDRYSEGEAYAREGLRECEGPLGTDHWMIANLRALLGANLAGLGRGEEALRMLSDGYEGLSNTVGAENGNALTAFRALLLLHASSGRLHEASAIAKNHCERLLAAGTDSTRLDEPAWFVAVIPGLEPGAYAAALEASARVVASESCSAGELDTYGACQYRLGRFEEALGTLRRAAELAAKEPAGPWLYDDAFLAMTHARLGHREEAAAALARARDLARIPEQAAYAAEFGFLREAEQVVEGK